MDGGRVVLAYGVNDCEAKLGEMREFVPESLASDDHLLRLLATHFYDVGAAVTAFFQEPAGQETTTSTRASTSGMGDAGASGCVQGDAPHGRHDTSAAKRARPHSPKHETEPPISRVFLNSEALPPSEQRLLHALGDIAQTLKTLPQAVAAAVPGAVQAAEDAIQESTQNNLLPNTTLQEKLPFAHEKN